MPGGQLEVVFRVVSLSGGTYFATLDVPQQKVSHMAVQMNLRGDTVVLAVEEAASRFQGCLLPDGRHLSGIWQQPGLRVPLTLEYAPAPVPTAPGTRLTPPYREEEVQFTNVAGQLHLAGQLTVPAGPGPFPAVVLLSDTGLQDRDGTLGPYKLLGALADYLTRRGVAVLRLDDRGAGLSGGAPAESLAQRVADAQAGMNFLRTRPEVDLSRIGLIGHGEGGNVALQAATLPLPPAFVLTLAAPGLPGTELVVRQQATTLRALGATVEQVHRTSQRQQAMLDIIRQTSDQTQAQAIVATMLRQTYPDLDAATAATSAADLTSATYRNFLLFNPLTNLADVKCPVLLLNGQADTSVEADANLPLLVKALKNSRFVSSIRLPGVNHLFQAKPTDWPLVNGQRHEIFSPQAQEAMRAWLMAQPPH